MADYLLCVLRTTADELASNSGSFAETYGPDTSSAEAKLAKRAGVDVRAFVTGLRQMKADGYYRQAVVDSLPEGYGQLAQDLGIVGPIDGSELDAVLGALFR